MEEKGRAAQVSAVDWFPGAVDGFSVAGHWWEPDPSLAVPQCDCGLAMPGAFPLAA